MPSTSDVVHADDTELLEIMENASISTENLTMRLEGELLKNLTMCELPDVDKQLRSIRGSLKMEVAKIFSWKKASSKKSVSSWKSETIQDMVMESEMTSGTELTSSMATYQLDKKASISSKAD